MRSAYVPRVSTPPTRYPGAPGRCHGPEAGVVLRGGRCLQLLLEHSQALRRFESDPLQQVEMRRDVEPAGLVLVFRAIRLDEVPVEQQPLGSQDLRATGIDLLHVGRATEIVQRPGRDDRVRRARQVPPPRGRQQVGLRQDDAACMGPQPAVGDVEHRAREIDAPVPNRGQVVEQMGREIARTDSQLDDEAGGRDAAPQLRQQQVEEGKAGGGRFKAGPPSRRSTPGHGTHAPHR